MGPPTSRLLLCPSTTVATKHVLAELREHGKGRPACVLVPNLRASAQLASHFGDSAGIHLWQFYELRDHILKRQALPLRLIDDTTVRRLVAQTLREACEAGVLTTFAPISDTPGFAVEILRWLREMKSRGVPPQTIEASGMAGNERDRQLAWLYRRYGERLAALNAIDSDGGLWLAAEALEQDAALCTNLERLVVTGFDQLSPVQVRMLRALAARIPISVYMLWDAGRPPGAPALARLAATRNGLSGSIPLSEMVLPEDDSEEVGLRHLRRFLFEAVTPRSSTGSLRAIAAPGREHEVRVALREAKKLLLDGVEPSCISVLATHPAAYGALVSAVAEEYGIPVGADAGLGESPAVATLLSLLALSPAFPRGATLAALRSPYCSKSGLTAEQVYELARLSTLHPVIGGRDQWLAAILSGEHGAARDDEELGDAQQSSRAQNIAALAGSLDAWFTLVTPPASGTAGGYRLWIEQALLGTGPAAGDRTSLRMADAAGEGPYAERDRRALEILERVMRRLAFAECTVPGPETDVSWDEYRCALVAEVSAARIPAGHGNAIRFGPLEAGRAISVDHLFVLGLAADVFPGRPPADVLYSPAERRAKPDLLLNPVPNSQACLWWQLLGNARQTITLLRPRLNEKGEPAVPSPYWSAALAPFSDIEPLHPPLDGLPAPAEACSLGELLAALAGRGATSAPGALAAPWAAAHRGLATEAERDGDGPPSRFEGMLPEAAPLLARRYGEQLAWPATWFNDYGKCPYYFFARHVLALEPAGDPEPGFDSRVRGSLIHGALERLYGWMARAGLYASAEHEGEILDALEAACAEEYRGAPEAMAFRPSPLWIWEQAEMTRSLRAYVRWECGNGGAQAWRPWRQEVAFGYGRGAMARARIGDEERGFWLAGRIDRIDRDAAGRLRVIDYKTGRTAVNKADMEEGRAVQVALYSLAMARLFEVDLSGVEGLYVMVDMRAHAGRIAGDDKGGALREGAVTHALGAIAATREGRYPIAPSQPYRSGELCNRRCDFGAVCRVSHRAIVKARGGIVDLGEEEA